MFAAHPGEAFSAADPPIQFFSSLRFHHEGHRRRFGPGSGDASGTLVATGEINVRKRFVALLLLSELTGAAFAQQAPPLLLHAATCLASKKQLPTGANASLSIGGWTDTKAYPGKKVLYLVATTGSNHSAGQVYSIFYSEYRHHQMFDIQNGTTFVQSNDGKGTINYVVPPIGLADAEPSFSAAIQQLNSQPRYLVTGAEISGPMKHTTCKSYVDNDQP